MEIRNALVAVDHRNRGAVVVARLDVGLDRGALGGGERGDLGNEVAETVVDIDADLGQERAVLLKHGLEERLDRVAEDDRVGDLHHRGLEMHGEQHALRLGACQFALEERDELLLGDESSVDDFAGGKLEAVLEHDRRAISANEFDLRGGRRGNRDRLLVGEEVALRHRGDMRLAIAAPRAHFVRIGAGVVLHALGRAAVGVAFANNGVHRATQDLRVAGARVLLGVGLRLVDIVGERVALLLEFGDCGLQLRDRRRDIRQLDDVGLGLKAKLSKLGEVVGDALLGLQVFRERRDDAARERDVAGLDIDPRRLGEHLDQREERIGRQHRRLVGVRVENRRSGGHRFVPHMFD